MGTFRPPRGGSGCPQTDRGHSSRARCSGGRTGPRCGGVASAPQGLGGAAASTGEDRGTCVVAPASSELVDGGSIFAGVGVLHTRSDRRAVVFDLRNRDRDHLLRRLDLLHLGRLSAVLRDGERRSHGRWRSAPLAVAAGFLGTAADRLAGGVRAADRNSVLQHQHVCRAGPQPEHAADQRACVPDVFGSIAFLVSSELAFAEVCHRWVCFRCRSLSWKIVALNLLGSIAFGASAIASLTVPSSGELLSVRLMNAGTALGGLCFLIGALLLIPESAREERTTPARPPVQASAAPLSR